MKYRYSLNIRIRRNESISFFINITDNSIFSINTNTLEYLTEKINDGLSDIDIKNDKSEFKNFVLNLNKMRILEKFEDD